MPAPLSYRLDTLSVHLVARLEATRRARLDDPEVARQAFARVVEESTSAFARECREVLGDEAQASLLEREARETFLPRYTRMALAQNKLEVRGYGGPLGDGPLARVVATVFAVMCALLLSRFLPGFGKEAVFLLAALTPMVPEMRLWWARRRWTADLQELADDLGRVQDAAEELPLSTAAGRRAPQPDDPEPDPKGPTPHREEAR